MAKFISTDGSIEIIDTPSVEQMQEFVGGMLDYSILPDATTVVLALDGSYGSDLPVNHYAQSAFLPGEILGSLQGNIIISTVRELS